MTIGSSGPAASLRVTRADRFLPRLRGWLGRATIDPDEALWIEPCWAVHGVGMRVAVDVVFLDAAGAVLRTARLPPWQVRCCVSAAVAVELADGAVARLSIKAGQPWGSNRGT